MARFGIPEEGDEVMYETYDARILEREGLEGVTFGGEVERDEKIGTYYGKGTTDKEFSVEPVGSVVIPVTVILIIQDDGSIVEVEPSSVKFLRSGK